MSDENNKLDRQSIFDKVWHDITVQGRGSMSDSGTCLYLAPDGCRCAVGVLLPPEFDPKLWEGAQPSSVYCSAFGMRLDHVDALFLRAMQCAHDGATRFGLSMSELPVPDVSVNPVFVREFQERMRKVAADYGLSVPEKL